MVKKLVLPKFDELLAKLPTYNVRDRLAINLKEGQSKTLQEYLFAKGIIWVTSGTKLVDTEDRQIVVIKDESLQFRICYPSIAYWKYDSNGTRDVYDADSELTATGKLKKSDKIPSKLAKELE